MLHTKPIIALVSLISHALAILPLSTNPAFNLATDSNLSSLNATPPPICDSVPYGYNLKEKSCEEAVARLNRGVSLIEGSIVFVNRDSDRDVKGPRFVLPWRELSSDGSCAVDVTLQPGVAQDRSTRQPLYEAASQIFDTCVAGEGSLGGAVKGLGSNENLIVTIKQYEGPSVECRAPAPGRDGGGGPSPASHCLAVLSFMPVDYRLQTFGPVGDSTVGVVVPKAFESAFDGSRCEVILSTYTSRIIKDQAVNWDIWAAATKVNAICVRWGMSGTASGIGSRKGLRISLTEKALLDGNSTGLG